MNDKEMLEVAGLSVCMENGSEEMKKIADVICPSVTEDGIKKAFEKISFNVVLLLRSFKDCIQEVKTITEICTKMTFDVWLKCQFTNETKRVILKIRNVNDFTQERKDKTKERGRENGNGLCKVCKRNL